MPHQKKQKMDENQANNLFWTDDEVQLLYLILSRIFKSKKLNDDMIDRESVKDKYFQIVSYQAFVLHHLIMPLSHKK